MKKFYFRLQKILDVKIKEEEEAKLELAKASSEYQRELNKKTRIMDNLKHIRETIKQNKKYDLFTLKNYDRFIQNADISYIEIDKILEEKRQIMEEKFNNYNKKKHEKMALEVLKEKAQKEYNYALNKEETEIEAEIAKNIYLKNHYFKET